MAELSDKWRPEIHIFLFLGVVYQCYAASVLPLEGPICYECDNVPFQRDCAKITKCGPHESCYGEKIVTSDASVFYKSGCKGSDICKAFETKKKRTTETVLCDRCCTDNYCNLLTCDSTPTPKPIKRCLACENVLQPDDCHNTKECDADETCFTETVLSVTNEKRFRLGCAHTVECGAAGAPDAIVGKRAAGDLSQYDNIQYCAQCCDGPNCNRNLCGGGLVGPKLINPPLLQRCYDVDTDACQALIGTGGTCSDLRIRNFLCPSTCGTCTGNPNTGGGSTNTQPTTARPPTTPHGTCFDAGERCSEDPDVVRLVCDVNPSLCRKSCGICGQGTSLPHMTTHAPPVTTHAPPVTAHAQCVDPINECQCTYMDRELSICADNDPKVSQFCCYYCNKKKGIHRCPIDYCERREQLEWSLVKHLANGTKCHDHIGQPLPFGK